MKNTFRYEKDLVAKFEYNVYERYNPFRITDVAFEFNYTNGRIDIVGICGKSILYAFEAKLKKWRDALDQAYRNSSFAHYSYVVLPDNVTENVLDNRTDFERRGIGLCTVNSAGIKVLFKAQKKRPIQPWLTNSALNFITESGYA
jgi:hypothetical protein